MTSFSDARRQLYGMSERAWAVYVDQGRPTDESVAEVIRISVAEELRRLRAQYKVDADREAERSVRLGRMGAPKWQHESSIASAQELAAFVRILGTRANEIDPDGAA